MLFIRTDSNLTISDGHVMRCLSIAKKSYESGLEVCFLISDDSSSKLLKEAGMKYIVLNSDWENLMTDFDEVVKILKRDKNPILLIDTYKINKEYVDALKPFCQIGYLGSKQEYLGELDFLINYSTDIDYKFYQDNYNHTKLLLGPAFAPLREEFQNSNHLYHDEIKRIMLTTGNTDPDKMVNSVLEKLLPVIAGTDIVIEVVVGRRFEDVKSLSEMFGQNKNVNLNYNIKSMSELMKKCDLAITANGTTVYELAAMGLPVISFAIVEEQVRSAVALSKLGVLEYCGEAYLDKEKCVRHVVEKVTYYITHVSELNELAKKAHELIDGNGCKKIVDLFM